MTAPLSGIQRVRLDVLVEQLKERRMHTKAGDLDAALQLIDTQAAVIDRYRNGWSHTFGTEGEGEWIDRLHGTRHNMTEAEQQLIYGEAH